MKIKHTKIIELNFIPIIQDLFKLESYQFLPFVLKIGKSCDHPNKTCLTPFKIPVLDKI